jgi:HEPN domain-containing protein
LYEHIYFKIEVKDKELFSEQNKPFGDQVTSAFPECNDDIKAAARCLALGESNASVFHSMRILELGLRALAREVELSDDSASNWQNIIDQIESKIRILGKSKRFEGKDEKLRHLSAAAVQFRYFKDAWRNHVTHARSSYDENTAQSIFDHVRDFMQELSTRQTFQE